MTYWRRAARVLLAAKRDLEEAESALSGEVLTEGQAHRHWKMVAEDAAERITELEAELVQERAEFDRLRAGLIAAAEAFDTASKAVRDAIPADPSSEFASDFAGWINLMGGLGDPDYMKGRDSCRHVDLRERAPRKKKEAET